MLLDCGIKLKNNLYLLGLYTCVVLICKYCRNYTVNLILSAYIVKAKNEGIAVETHIDLPENTAVADMDLCVIFANALENAVNACKRIPSAIDRTLKIVCKTKGNKPHPNHQ